MTTSERKMFEDLREALETARAIAHNLVYYQILTDNPRMREDFSIIRHSVENNLDVMYILETALNNGDHHD